MCVFEGDDVGKSYWVRGGLCCGVVTSVGSLTEADVCCVLLSGTLVWCPSVDHR